MTEYPLPEPVVMASRLIPDANGIYGHLYTESQMREAYAKGREDMREECVKVCDSIATTEYARYKGRTDPIDRAALYNPHVEGVSDGASQCVDAIGELK